MSLLSIKDIKKVFPDQKIIVIVGRVGTGKTSIAKALADELNGYAGFLDAASWEFIIDSYKNEPKKLMDIYGVEELPVITDVNSAAGFYAEHMRIDSFPKLLDAAGRTADNIVVKEIVKRQLFKKDSLAFSSGWESSGSIYESCNTKNYISIWEGITETRELLELADIIIKLTSFPQETVNESLVERQIKNFPSKEVLLEKINVANEVVDARNKDLLQGLKVLQVPNNRDRSPDEVASDIARYFYLSEKGPQLVNKNFCRF